MWNKMKKVGNPFDGHTRKERKLNIRDILKSQKIIYKEMKANGGTMAKPTLRSAKMMYKLGASDVWYANDLYQVAVDYISYKDKGIIHLSMKTHDRSTSIPWQHKQWIKNDICGDEMEAVELFPAESRMINTANQYHLWVMEAVPVGWECERVVTNLKPGGEGSRGKQTLATREGR
jgi:phosphorylcholine metabolism protein LicD